MRIQPSTVFAPLALLLALLLSAAPMRMTTAPNPDVPRCPAGTTQLADGSHELGGPLPGNADTCLFPTSHGWVVINH